MMYKGKNESLSAIYVRKNQERKKKQKKRVDVIEKLKNRKKRLRRENR